MVDAPTRAIGAIVNVGGILTGDIHRPRADGNTILIEDGVITAIGLAGSLPDPAPGSWVIDARGQIVMPGLIDSHIHPVVGDWAPQQRALDWLRGLADAGITTALSQGSWIDGYPSDARGMVALATTLQRHFRAYDAAGLKLHGSAVSVVDGLDDGAFKELAAEGIWLIAEVGVRSLTDPVAVAETLAIAHKNNFVSRVHFGPESVPGTSTVSAADAIAFGAHIASHVNGGPTTPPRDEIDTLVKETEMWLEVSSSGNHETIAYLIDLVESRGGLHRVIIGTDTPTGFGVTPRAILQTVADISARCGIGGAEAVCLATGNTAAAYRLNNGVVAVGREADLLLVDAPIGSTRQAADQAIEAGDILAISQVVIDGAILPGRRVNSIPTKRTAQVMRWQ